MRSHAKTLFPLDSTVQTVPGCSLNTFKTSRFASLAAKSRGIRFTPPRGTTRGSTLRKKGSKCTFGVACFNRIISRVRKTKTLQIARFLSQNFPDKTRKLHCKLQLLVSSGNFPDYPDTFLDHPTPFRVSRNIFLIIQILFTSYGNFLVHPDTF